MSLATLIWSYMVVQRAPLRREFLRVLACGSAGMALRVMARGQGAGATVQSDELAGNIVDITGAGANILLVTGSAGSVMVDDGLAERSAEVMKIVSDRCGGKPVRLAFNTHWHAENTGSNEVIAKAGAKIIAHENTKLTMGMDMKARPKEALPSETFYASAPVVRKMLFESEPIEYGYLPQAHTDGDIYVFFPRPNILMAGDVVSTGQYPILDNSSGGWIGGMARASKTLLQVANADTRIVPGHGPLMNRAALEAQSKMLSTVFDRFVKLMKQGMGPEDMIAAAPTKEFDEKWGDPRLLIASAYRGLWGHARELGGVI
jgi:cyclase